MRSNRATTFYLSRPSTGVNHHSDVKQRYPSAQTLCYLDLHSSIPTSFPPKAHAAVSWSPGNAVGRPHTVPDAALPGKSPTPNAAHLSLFGHCD